MYSSMVFRFLFIYIKIFQIFQILIIFIIFSLLFNRKFWFNIILCKNFYLIRKCP